MNFLDRAVHQTNQFGVHQNVAAVFLFLIIVHICVYYLISSLFMNYVHELLAYHLQMIVQINILYSS